MQKITPCLWFNNQAEEAVALYCSVFKNSKKLQVTHYGDSGSKASGQPKGMVMTISFEVEGQQFTALNGGPHFKFTPAISLVVNCESQAEVDEVAAKLTSGGGEIGHCGWVTDKFGLSWQIVPKALFEFMRDPHKGERVMAALMEMKKIDLATLERAYKQA
jgi:predicted 3-demethylubiquinone-9 3-methyltransferase (glyoxalase superfamily)